MKQLFFLIIMALGLSSGVVSAQCCRNNSSCGYDRYEQEGCRRYRPQYFISGDKVFFDGREIKGVSASSFEILSDSYAKDTWTVYFLGEKIKGASSTSFQVLGYGYARDNWNVYYDGKKISGASPDSFKVLTEGYAKDNWNTYHFGRKI